MSAPGYRLCWCSCLALVLLRVAIGTHFLYEGLSKIDSWRAGARRFSAEGYLANSSGPLRAWFRSQLDDPDGLQRLDPAGIAQRWEQEIAALDTRHQLTEEQKAGVRAKLGELEQAKDNYFNDPETKRKIAAYREAIQQVAGDEQGDPKFIREHAATRRTELGKRREELLAPIDAWTRALSVHVADELSAEQLANDSSEKFGTVARWLNLPFKLEWPERPIDQINLVTMCGLVLAGGCLLIGLFSRLSALWAAAFLAMIYLANPPAPLGAGNPADFGNYLFVNKELIECLAALVLATIPTGRWLGVDALIRGLFTRRMTAAVAGVPDDALVRS